MESSLTLLLREVSKYPLLTKEEELELGRRIKDENDQAARDRMIMSNMRLVVSVAKPFISTYRSLPLEDLISNGTLGLITAVGKYDYTLGYRFSTCAVPWIKQAIMKGIADNSRTIRIPANVIQQFNQYNKAIDDLSSEGISNPTDEQIGAKMGKTVQDIGALRQWKQNTASLETPLGDEEGNTIGDLYADEGDLSPSAYVQLDENRIFVKKLLDGCDERTRTIFKLRFGLGEEGDPEEYMVEHTLEEIGGLLNPKITRERVRQIVAQQLTRWKMAYGDTIKDLL